MDHLASYAFYLPDAFASEPVAHPPELVAFQWFNLVMSRESGRNVDTGIAKKDAFEVVRHSRRLGIRPATYAAVGRQLLAERRQPAMSNRRRTYQSVLLFDIFARQLRRTRPRFSTFFTNHVASAMHRGHGRARRAPCRGQSRCPAVIASSMGQRATMSAGLETQLYLTQPARFFEAMGLPDEDAWQHRPAMLPQFNLVVEDKYVEQFRDALGTVQVGGEPLRFKQSGGGFFSLDFGLTNGTTAYHVPEGILAVYDPARPPAGDGARPEVSVLEVAPALLQALGVEPSPYMARPALLAELLPA